MRLIGIGIVACIGLAFLRAAVTAIVILTVGAVVASALVQPLKTFSAVFALLCLGLIGQHPMLGVVLLATVVVIKALKS